MFTIPKNVAKHSVQYSWFSIKHFSSNSINELPVQSITSSLEDENISNFKTIKIVLKPNSNQTKKLFDSMNLWSWYYNASISILYNNKENLNSIKYGNKYSYEKGRDLLYHYYYDKSNSEKFIRKDNNEEKSIPLPCGRKINTIHNRLPRGAVKLFISNLNSSYTLHKGNLSNVKFAFKSKKANNKNLLYFEDKSYPKWINEIKGYYKDTNNKKISFETIRNKTKNRSITIQYDNIKNKFFMYWPVDKEVFETQENIFYRPKKNNLPIQQSNIVAVDPGIRTFCTSYCSNGNVTEICNENQYLYKYHKQIINYKENKAKTVFNKFLNTKRNKNIDKKILKIYKCMRNKVDDLHWKSINVLSQLGKTILYPSFHVKQMLMQEKFPDNIKRVMSSLCFYKFKIRLKNKLEKRVIIVSEKLSSKTCYNCGNINKELGSNKVYDCKNCKVCIPRDWNGSVNILKMNIILKVDKKVNKSRRRQLL